VLGDRLGNLKGVGIAFDSWPCVILCGCNIYTGPVAGFLKRETRGGVRGIITILTMACMAAEATSLAMGTLFYAVVQIWYSHGRRGQAMVQKLRGSGFAASILIAHHLPWVALGGPGCMFVKAVGIPIS
jgi:hypothetical protein